MINPMVFNEPNITKSGHTPWLNPWQRQVDNTVILPSDIQLVCDHTTYQAVNDFRNAVYQSRYPQVPTSNHDQFDESAVTFYGIDCSGDVSSTARLVVDSELGLPEENILRPYLTKWRAHKQRVAEFGRFVIQSNQPDLLKHYYKSIYLVCRALGVCHLALLVRHKELNFYLKRVGATLLCHDTGLTFGSSHRFAALVWTLSNTRPRFLQWMEIEKGGEQ